MSKKLAEKPVKVNRYGKLDRVGEKNITNEGYTVEIVEYFGKENCTVKFIENSNTLKNIQYIAFKLGTVKNPHHTSVYGVGFLGVGKYKTSINKVATNEYRIWKSVIRRCYDDKELEKSPTYKGCSVAEEWHNFQNFAKWFEENYNPEYMEGWHLDKDILSKENKIYSPDTCAFVPQEINSLFTKTTCTRGEYPIGVYFSKKGRKFATQISKGTKQRLFLGYYNTTEQAFQVYKTAKEGYIKEVADKWKGQITERVYEVMYNYKVEITD
jgi:hypothetical protein